jgi:hypothetical protein
MLTGALGIALGSVFISFSQAYEDRHFTKPCLPHTLFLTGTRVLLAVSSMLTCAAESKSTPIVVSLSGSTGTRSKRNFHRPQSNCGMALNSGCRVFIVFQSPLRLRIQSPRQSTGSVPQSRKKCSNLSFQESVFSSCHFSQASEDRHFRKFEIFLPMLWTQ